MDPNYSAGNEVEADADAQCVVPAEPVKRRIRVGAGGPLSVPREDLGLDHSSDLDFGAYQPAPVRRPGRLEWIALKPAISLETRLLPLASGPGGMDKTWYYVDPDLRGPIREEIRDCLVHPFYSELHRSLFLWIVTINEGNAWYESLRPALEQPESFYDSHFVRIISSRLAGRYKCKQRPANVANLYQWPNRLVTELLGEALGPDNFITSVDHPVYRELVAGQDLD